MVRSQQHINLSGELESTTTVKRDVCSDWLRLVKGDENALMTIYDHCYDTLHAYGYRISKNIVATEDCIQDIFLELWEKREKLPEVRFVKAYLLKILKRKLCKLHIPQDVFFDLGDSRVELVDESKEEMIIAEENSNFLSSRLEQAMNKLTKRQREIINLKFFTELTYDEIASFTGLSQQRIYNLAHDAVRELRTSLCSIPRHVAALFLAVNLFN